MSNPTLERDFPVTYGHNCLTVKLPQHLTLIESISFQKLCSELIEQNRTVSKIILDFKDTRFINSSGIGALIRIHVMARAYRQELIFQQMQPLVIAALEMADLAEIFQIQPPKLSLAKRDFTAHPFLPLDIAERSNSKRAFCYL